MNIILYILRSNLEIVGVVDTVISLIWKVALTRAGNFELYVPATPAYRKLLVANRFVARADTDSFMYITTVQEKNESDGTKIIVSGYSAEGIFRKRLYPEAFGYTWESKEGPKDIAEVVESMSPLGFNCNFGSLITNNPSIADVPASYFSGNMEDYFRYILSRTQTEKEDTNGNEYYWYKLIPESYRLWINENSWYGGPNNQIQAVFEVVPLYGEMVFAGYTEDGDIIEKPYMPEMPACMFSEDIGNITGLQYSYSEEDCFSTIYALVNRDFSKTVTETNIKFDTETGQKYEEKTTRNIGFDDLDIEMDENKNPKLPVVWKNKADDILGQTEKVIFVDPVIKGWERSVNFESWNAYTNPNMKSNTAYGPTTYESEGKIVRMHPRYQTTHYYKIDRDATCHKMSTEIDKIILKSTENFQGTFNLSYKDFKNNHGHGQMFKLGDIVIVRDNDRLIDFYKRVEEIEETFDRNGYKVVPTLGEPLKTIWDKI